MPRIADNLKFLRKKKNTTQKAFGELFNATKASIGAYEEGRAEPKLAFLNKVCKHFSISLDELVNTNLFMKSEKNVEGTELAVFQQKKESIAKTKRKCFLPFDLPQGCILLQLEKENKYFDIGSYIVALQVQTLTELNQHDVLLDAISGKIEKVSNINFGNTDYYKLLYSLELVKGREKNPSLEKLTETVIELQAQLIEMKSK